MNTQINGKLKTQKYMSRGSKSKITKMHKKNEEIE